MSGRLSVFDQGIAPYAGEGAELVAFPGVNAPFSVNANPLAWGGGMQVTFLTAKVAACNVSVSRNRG